MKSAAHINYQFYAFIPCFYVNLLHNHAHVVLVVSIATLARKKTVKINKAQKCEMSPPVVQDL